MIERSEHECRQLFACEGCGLVYACYEEPSACHLCETSMFTTIHPVAPD